MAEELIPYPMPDIPGARNVFPRARRDPDRDPDVALRYPCSFCAAPPGVPCAGGGGRVLDLPHYSRTPVAEEVPDA